ncbi:hypothetical protein J2S00_001770 [Caldalkalibacillus uzonensis]|uniref:Aminopyrimidine aminohydrolase n=1 Tax=Caldalkalibacillus uzonensis TaxID=353224 RepID=A0ABU0CRI6_9BACI|nr:hypothetical protein [Caldalkalibacillus uzonensis]
MPWVKAHDVATMGRFARLLDATLNVEMDLHRQYAKKFGISEQELEQAQPAPTTLAYTHYMLHVAQNGTLAELVASLLPCMWSYHEIGRLSIGFLAPASMNFTEIGSRCTPVRSLGNWLNGPSIYWMSKQRANQRGSWSVWKKSS